MGVTLELRNLINVSWQVINGLYFLFWQFNVFWRCAVRWIIRIGATDVGDFGNHVIFVGLESYTDILHAITFGRNDTH